MASCHPMWRNFDELYQHVLRKVSNHMYSRWKTRQHAWHTRKIIAKVSHLLALCTPLLCVHPTVLCCFCYTLPVNSVLCAVGCVFIRRVISNFGNWIIITQDAKPTKEGLAAEYTLQNMLGLPELSRRCRQVFFCFLLGPLHTSCALHEDASLFLWVLCCLCFYAFYRWEVNYVQYIPELSRHCNQHFLLTTCMLSVLFHINALIYFLLSGPDSLLSDFLISYGNSILL